MKSLITHPLFHFALAGAVLYFFFSRSDKAEADSGDRSREIVITNGHIDQLVSIFQKTWQRPPTASELQGLIDDFVKEEIYYREAINLGLDRDDTIIRRRMRQKIEFLTNDLNDPGDPGDEILVEYLEENPDKYRIDPRYSLRQVYLDPAKQDDVEAAVKGLVEELNGSEGSLDADQLSEMSDGLQMLSAIQKDRTKSQIGREFGADFADSLADLPVGEWSGPIRSGYGIHVVRIDGKEEGRAPELAEVRAEVLRDWSSQQQNIANTELYESLFHRYTITLEREDGARSIIAAPGSPSSEEAPPTDSATAAVPAE